MTRNPWWSPSAAESPGIQRPFTRLRDAANLGPTGERLWATYVSNEPGMQGSFEFIHKVNLLGLFSLKVTVDGTPIALSYRTHEWHPSHLKAVFAGDGIELIERKFITWDDCAVDVVTLSGTSRSGKRPSPEIEWGVTREGERTGPDWSFTAHGQQIHVAGGSRETAHGIVICAAMGLSGAEARSTLERRINVEDPLSLQLAQYAAWFDDVPQFECSDPALERMWDYRWYLLRRNLANPRAGRLPHPLYYEGRSAKMSLDAWHPKGWEFSKLIPFGTAFHLLDGRWKCDASACKGEVLNLARNTGDDGLFRVVSIQGTGADYTDLVPWGTWQLYLVQRDRKWLAHVGPSMVEQIRGTIRAYDENRWTLPIARNHNRTGKEYQPSFFHKPGYPKRPKTDQGTPLARVDAACYLYLNAQATACIMSELGDVEQASEMEVIAGRVRSAILERMWDPARGFFYDVDAETGLRVPVENVVGFDPFLAGIAGADQIRAFDLLSDPKCFRAPWPVPSTSLSSPAYAPNASWMGDHVKGEHGAMWNGPTWPFTNSTVLMAIANATRGSGHRLDPVFAYLFRRYTLMCFRDGDLNDPVIYEHYNPETGQPISQEEDYLHSTWIDLVVRCLAGIEPQADGRITFDPIDCDLESFSLRGLWVAGMRVDVAYSQTAGYSATVDGKPTAISTPS